MSESKPSFWHTLPGILTGAASFITACIALLTFFTHSSKVENNPPPSSTPSSIKLQNIDHCREFEGKWDWFIGGELRADKKGYVDWRKDPNADKPEIAGRWTCVESNPKSVNISWSNGISETLAFSPDKKSLSGVNTIGVRVSGTKK